MINTLIDSLGLSVIGGFSHARSEESEHIIKALQLLDIDCRHATLMTDEGSAYPAVAKRLEMKHVLCSHHYSAQILPARAGLPLHLGDQFMRDANAAIYNDFHSVNHLENHIDN